MLRPFALVGFTYLLTLTAAVSFGAPLSLALACGCLLLCGLSMWVPSLHKTGILPVTVLTMSLAFATCSMADRAFSENARTLSGRTAEAEFVLCELPVYEYNRAYYTVELCSLDGETLETPLKVRLSSTEDIGAEPFDRVRAVLSFSLPKNSASFSSRNYYASRGISALARLDLGKPIHLVQQEKPKPPYYYALMLRRALTESIREVMPKEEAGLVCGILLGDTSGISDEAAGWFRTIGLSHILAVSGMHLATLTGLLLALLRKARLPRRLANLAAALGVVGFMAITGFSASVSRSGLMFLLMLAAGALSRKPDALNSLGLAVFLLCLQNPFAAADTGLLLSASATLGLILLTPALGKWLNAHLKLPGIFAPAASGLSAVLSTSIAASLFTLPVLVLQFGRVSPISLLANLLQVWPATLLIQLAAAGCVLCFAIPWVPLYYPLFAGAFVLARYVLRCAQWLADFPLASVSTAGGFASLWLACVLLLLAAAVRMPPSRVKYPACAALGTILLFSGTLSYQLTTRGVTRVAFVGTDGVSAVIQRGSHAAVVGCSAGTSEIQNVLQDYDVKTVDYLHPLVVSGAEGKAAAALLKSTQPGRVLLPGSEDGADHTLWNSARVLESVVWCREQAKTRVWDSLTVETQDGAAFLQLRDVTVLLCGKNTNFTALPARWKQADLVALGKEPPAGAGLSPFYTVLAMPKEDARLVRGVQDVLCTESGAIILEIAQDSKIKIRRGA